MPAFPAGAYTGATSAGARALALAPKKRAIVKQPIDEAKTEKPSMMKWLVVAALLGGLGFFFYRKKRRSPKG